MEILGHSLGRHSFKKKSEVMEQRKALGKGLGALITNGRSEPVSSYNVREVPVCDIVTNPNQPRKLFSKESLDELASSIEEKGILQPILVRHIGGGKYEIIAGERRFRAAKQIQLETIPVIVKNIEDDETLELALIENIQREDLNPIEEALAYRDLLSKFQYTQDELAKRIGKDRSSIANSLRLLKLPDQIRTYVINNELSMGHARALLSVEDKEVQIQMAKDMIANHLSVRDAEMLIKKYRDNYAETMTQPPAKSKAQIHTVLEGLEKQLQDKLKLPVKLQGDKQKGKIILSYFSSEEFDRVVDSLLQK